MLAKTVRDIADQYNNNNIDQLWAEIYSCIEALAKKGLYTFTANPIEAKYVRDIQNLALREGFKCQTHLNDDETYMIVFDWKSDLK